MGASETERTRSRIGAMRLSDPTQPLRHHQVQQPQRWSVGALLATLLFADGVLADVEVAREHRLGDLLSLAERPDSSGVILATGVRHGEGSAHVCARAPAIPAGHSSFPRRRPDPPHPGPMASSRRTGRVE